MIKTKKRRLLAGLLVCSDRLSCEVEAAETKLPLEDGGGVTEDGRMLFFFAILSVSSDISPNPLIQLRCTNSCNCHIASVGFDFDGVWS